MTMLPEPNDIRETLRRLREAETLIRAVDPRFFDTSYLAEMRRIADDSRNTLNTLTALGYIRVRRAVPQARDARTPTYQPPQKRGPGRAPGKRTRTRDLVFATLNTCLDAHATVPTLEWLAKKLRLSRTAMYGYINDAAYFGSRAAFKRYCEDYLKHRLRR